jgi:hypothetical protein
MKNSQSGQIGVIIILIMTVLLTVGLSIATRSTQDLAVTTQQSDSTRVFNAAEAGVEEALAKLVSGEYEGGSIDNLQNADVSYSISQENQLEIRLFEGKGVKINLDGVNTGNSLNITWAKESDCGEDPASLIVNIFYDDGGTTKVRHLGYAACDHGDGFVMGSNGSGDFFREVSIPLQGNDIMAHIEPVYNDTQIGISGGGWTLPVQSYLIRSQAENTQGNETRIIEVSRTLDKTPSVFDYTLYSGTTIVK